MVIEPLMFRLPRVRVITVCALAALVAGCEVGVEQVPISTAQAGPTSAARAAGTPIARGLLHFVGDYQAGFEQAAREGKPLLVFFTAEWCQYCHQMADEAFTNPQVQRLSEHFVCVLIDADAEPALCQQFQVTAFPTIQFISPRGVPLERMVGKKPGHQVMMAMQAALQSVARRYGEVGDTLLR